MSSWLLRVLMVAACAAAVAAPPASDWPGWRGPTGMGLSGERGLPLAWSEKDAGNVRWKVPLPGQEGNSEPDQNQSHR